MKILSGLKTAGLIVLAAVIYVVSTFLAAFMAEPLSGHFGGMLYCGVYTLLLIGFSLLLYGLVIRFIDKKSFQDYSLDLNRHWALKLVLGLGMGIGAFVLTCLPLYLTENYSLGPGFGSYPILLMDFLFYISVGFGEEMLCRGYIQHKLLKLGPLASLFITSGLFSLLHFFNPEFSLLAFLNIFLAGVFMGASMYASRSLFMPIGIHITWNWIQGAVLGIPVSGGSPGGFFFTEIAGSSHVLTGGDFGAEASIICTLVLTVLSVLLLVYAQKKGYLEEYRRRGRDAGKAGNIDKKQRTPEKREKEPVSIEK